MVWTMRVSPGIFLIVAPGLIVYDRLLDAFCGKQMDGVRDFASSDIAQCAELFIPENHRERCLVLCAAMFATKTRLA